MSGEYSPYTTRRAWLRWSGFDNATSGERAVNRAWCCLMAGGEPERDYVASRRPPRGEYRGISAARRALGPLPSKRA